MTELMKHNQTMDTNSNSLSEKQRKELEADKKELQFQLDEERKELQRVLGNFLYWKCWFHNHTIINYQPSVI